MPTSPNPKASAQVDVARAKARLIEIAAQIDPLAPMRKHPYITAATALTAGIIAGATSEKLVEAAVLTRATNAFMRTAALVVEGFNKACSARSTTYKASGDSTSGAATGVRPESAGIAATPSPASTAV